LPNGVGLAKKFAQRIFSLEIVNNICYNVTIIKKASRKAVDVKVIIK